MLFLASWVKREEMVLLKLDLFCAFLMHTYRDKLGKNELTDIVKEFKFMGRNERKNIRSKLILTKS